MENERKNDIISVQWLLKWLVRGKRSLSLDELSHCLAIDLEEENDGWDIEAVMQNPADIFELCSSLLTVSDDGRKVDLAHYTVQEFLLSDEAKKNIKTFYLGDRNIDAELAKVCLTYLNYNDFLGGGIEDEAQFSELLDKYKFYEYASLYWDKHAHVCPEEGDDLLCLNMRLLHSESEGRQNYLLWNQVYSYAKSGHKFAIPSRTAPVYYAAYFGLARSLTTLLDEGSQFDFDNDDIDPTLAAVQQGFEKIVQIFFDHYDERDQAKLSRYLYLAASKGHDSLIDLLLEREAHVDERGGKQGAPLQVAVVGGHTEVVEKLLKAGASTKVVCARFRTPLAAAAEKGVEKTFQLLLNAGASINGKGGWYSYPLISAIVGKNNTLIQILLNKGANVNLIGGRHVCALMAAAALGKRELVEQLINLGAKVNDENDKGADALHAACCAGRYDIVELLLDSGADVDAKGGKHRNALNAASAEGHPRIVEKLLEAGANALDFDENYGNAIQAAALRGYNENVKILANAGADLNATSGVRGSALVSAASSGQVETIKLLFEMGVPSGPTEDVANAMVMAVHKQHGGALLCLLDYGANIDAPGFLSGVIWTPLQLAANKGNVNMVALILDRGADV